MKRKLVLIMVPILCICTLIIILCNSKLDAIRFKNDYESLNSKSNSRGYSYREVNIPKSNPFIYSTASEIINKIDNNETFYVYFGSKLCPWCRSVIEKAISVSGKYNIDTIYYIDIWDDDGNEILRDKYKLEGNSLVKTIDGTKEYFKLLYYFNDLLDEYTIDGDNQKFDTLEKRIYAPTFIFVENGKATKITTGVSDIQNDSREELSEEILNDEETKFRYLFTDYCDSAC